MARSSHSMSFGQGRKWPSCPWRPGAEQRWSHTSYAVAQTLVNRCFSNVTHPLAEYCCHIHNGRVPVQLTMQMMKMLISRSAVFCIF
uniref:Uncharacterized protein n=1 Tax=Triticum urartu TaxID=4572 RepID=A0A8R7TF43_TRIUA